MTSSSDTSSSQTTSTDGRIVAMLRELARLVHGTEADPERQAEALARLTEARELLTEGSDRVRWYEASAESRSTRARNRELSTFTGSLNAIAPPMTVRPTTLPDGRPALVGSVRLDRLREGPPRSVHGGVIAGLFDELLGAGQRLGGGPPGMTGRLTVRYRRPTPVDADLEFRVWIDDERTRRVVVRGDCRVVTRPSEEGDNHEPDEPVTAEAEAIFLRVDFAGLDDMMRTRTVGTAPATAPPRTAGP